MDSRDFTASLNNLCQLLVTITMFPGIQLECPLFQFMLIATGPVTGHHLKEPGSTFVSHSLQVFMGIDKVFPWTFCSPGLTGPATSDLSHMWDASVTLSLLWTIISMSASLFYSGSSGLDTICQLWLHQSWTERQDHSSWPAGSTPSTVWNNRLCTAIAHFWLLFNLVSNRTPKYCFPAVAKQ